MGQLLNACGRMQDTPASYMDELIREEEEAKGIGKKKIDVVGAAMKNAVGDLKKYMIGVHFSDEEGGNAEGD
jgi:hypothetical protein